MEFFEIKKHIRKVKDNYFVIGTKPLDPLVIIDGKHLIVDKITTKELDAEITTSSKDRLTLSEAFEVDENGEMTPVESDNISDSMWILREGGNLELRTNHWRHNLGTAAILVKDGKGDLVMQEADDFPEDISF